MDKRALWLFAVLAASACGGQSVTNVYETGDAACAVASDAAVGVDAGGADAASDASPDVAPDVAADAPADVQPDVQEAGVIPIGQPCTTDYDCVSSACDSVSLTCVASECTDHRLDGAETDVDCGGFACPVCATGQHCKVDTDCSTFACDALTHVCITNQCADHTKDGAETDIDCGGVACSACAVGYSCKQQSDCASGFCDAVALRCVSNHCEDHRQDGDETDVDCGGPVCASCQVGQKCISSADCQSGHFCNGSTKLCQ
jgi:hypothetical protein